MTWFELIKSGVNPLDNIRHLDWNKLTSQSKEKVIDGYINFWLNEHPDDIAKLPELTDELNDMFDAMCEGGECNLKPSDWNNNHFQISNTDSFSIIFYNDRFPMITALVTWDDKFYPIGEGKAKEWMMTKLNMNHLKTEHPSNIIVEAGLWKLMEFET